MRIVLRKGAHPHDTVQRARRLVAMAGAELGQPHRQLTVTPQAIAEDQHMAGAIHWLQRQDFLVAAFGDEHVLLEIRPVPGGFP